MESDDDKEPKPELRLELKLEKPPKKKRGVWQRIPDREGALFVDCRSLLVTPKCEMTQRTQ